MSLSYLASEADMPFPDPIELLLDNASAEAFMRDTCEKSRLTHVDKRLEWVRLLRRATIITPKHCPSAQNEADWLTKALPKSQFLEARKRQMSE